MIVFDLRCAVVVAVEHLDGSAVAAKYRDEKGRRRWITHAGAERPFDDISIADRSKQLRQVTQGLRYSRRHLLSLLPKPPTLQIDQTVFVKVLNKLAYFDKFGVEYRGLATRLWTFWNCLRVDL